MSAAITVVCPNCKNKMRASAEHLGRKGRCPACKALVEIVAEDSSLVSLAPAGDAGSRREARLDSTDINGLLAAAIGLAATIVLYAVVFFPIGSTYLGQLFVDRGRVPYVTTWVACWGFALLAMKYLAVKRQMAAAERELELIPLEIGLQITPDNVDQFLGHLATLPPSERGSILARRVRGAIEHFKYRNRVPEVQGYLASQAEIDASGVDGGYTLLRSIVWAVPILGFIGTVVGISAAVKDLADVMPRNQPGVSQPAENAGPEESLGAKLMGAMGSVTKNLAVAFDTTLVALALAIFLLFLTESLRKTEYGGHGGRSGGRAAAASNSIVRFFARWVIEHCFALRGRTRLSLRRARERDPQRLWHDRLLPIVRSGTERRRTPRPIAEPGCQGHGQGRECRDGAPKTGHWCLAASVCYEIGCCCGSHGCCVGVRLVRRRAGFACLIDRCARMVSSRRPWFGAGSAGSGQCTGNCRCAGDDDAGKCRCGRRSCRHSDARANRSAAVG
jgi:hypothetical protein